MKKKLIVTLLRKSIQELEMITEGFMEMDHYPTPHIQLAQRKTEDIQTYIQLLSTVMPEIIEPVQLTTDSEEVAHTDYSQNENQLNELSNTTTTPTQESINEQSDLKTSENKDLTPETEDLSSIEDTTAIYTEEIADETEKEIEIIEEEIHIDVEEITAQINNNDIEVITETRETLDAEYITSTYEDVKEEIIEEKFTSNETKTFVEETKKSVIGEKNATTTITRNELLSKTENTISSTLANKKITDIKQAINIGDRFRFQRELFRGNGEDMNKTISYVNQLATLNEALSFLKSKYGWATDNDTAEDFYQIVRRRFL